MLFRSNNTILGESFLDRLYMADPTEKENLKRLIRFTKSHLTSAVVTYNTQLKPLYSKIVTGDIPKLNFEHFYDLNIEFIEIITQADIDNNRSIVSKNAKERFNKDVNSYHFANISYIHIPHIHNSSLPYEQKVFYTYRVMDIKNSYNRITALSAYDKVQMANLNISPNATKKEITILNNLINEIKIELKCAHICQVIFDLYSERANILDNIFCKLDSYIEYVELSKLNK